MGPAAWLAEPVAQGMRSAYPLLAVMPGFSSRKGDISIYLVAGFPGQDELLSLLGRHKMGKACLYVRQLADVDLKVLEKLVRDGFAHTRARYPS